MAVRVDESPRLLAWARERSRIDADALVRKFPALPAARSSDGEADSATSLPVAFFCTPL